MAEEEGGVFETDSAIMFLGPTKLKEQDAGQQQSILRTFPDLLAVRRELRDQVVRSRGIPCIVMEDFPDRPKHTDKFLGLIAEHNVDSIFIIWPYGSIHNGMDIELGHILGWLATKRWSPDAITIFTEHGVVTTDAEDHIIGHGEKGNRSRYYDDLLAYGVPYFHWRTLVGLHRQVFAACIEHYARATERPQPAPPRGRPAP